MLTLMKSSSKDTGIRPATVSQERLKKLLYYSKTKGTFAWRVSPNGRVHVGDKAGCPNSSGRVTIGVDGRYYYAHRLAWLYVYGVWPDPEVDHKNCDFSDNRIQNLRLATRSQNARNKRFPQANNKTGLLGVSWKARNKKWCAQIRCDGRVHHLGLFTCPVEAHRAYLKAKKMLHQHGG